MASKQPVMILPPNTRTNLFPSPLHIRKKPRRASRKATFYRRIIRKSLHQPQPQHEGVYGPLDDIITEISSDIWASPSRWNIASTMHELALPLEDSFEKHNPLKAASTCTVSTVTMTHPVSRIPSDQPLTIRKNRASRSTGSEQSATHSMMAISTSSNSNETLQPGPEEAQLCGDPKPTKRRSSRARLLPGGLARLLRAGSDAKAPELPTCAEDCNSDGEDQTETPRTFEYASIPKLSSRYQN